MFVCGFLIVLLIVKFVCFSECFGVSLFVMIFEDWKYFVKKFIGLELWWLGVGSYRLVCWYGFEMLEILWMNFMWRVGVCGGLVFMYSLSLVSYVIFSVDE